MADGYRAAVREGNEGAITWLMPRDREDRASIDERIARYRSIGNERVDIEYVPSGNASYITLVRFRVRGALFDEIALEQIRLRWYLVNLPRSP